MYYTLLIPNMEVRMTYVQIIDHYFTAKIGIEKIKKLAVVFSGKDVYVKE